MPDVEVLELEPEVNAPVIPEPGDWINVVFWMPNPMPDNPRNGSWEYAECQVVSAGPKTVVVQTDNPSIMSRDAIYGSTLRFVPLTHVFANVKEANKFAKQLKPPVG